MVEEAANGVPFASCYHTLAIWTFDSVLQPEPPVLTQRDNWWLSITVPES